jgi:uncharacterized protein
VESGDLNIVRNHSIATSDGVDLLGDLYLPSAPGRRGLIVYRTPYAKERLWNDFYSPIDCAASGLAAYVQDMRGFGRSEGLPNFSDWAREAQDTFDTVNSLRSETWCNGKIGLAGTSFQGMVLLSSLEACGDLITAAAPSMVTAQPFEQAAVGPSFRFAETIVWAAQMLVQNALRRVKGDVGQLTSPERELGQKLSDPEALFASLQRRGIPQSFDEVGNGVLSRIVAGHVAPYPHLDVNRLATTPMMICGGWYDTFSTPTVALADAQLENSAASLHVHGPWSHSNSLFSNIGAHNFGPNASGQGAGLIGRHAEFFLHHLADREPPTRGSSEFVLFGKKWRPKGHEAQSGRLDLTTPSARPRLGLVGGDTFVPTLGGQTHFTANGVPGPMDQRPLLARNDTLYLASQRLQDAVELSGQVRFTVGGLEGNAPALFAKLCIERADGAIFPIQETVCATSDARHAHGVAFPRIRAVVEHDCRLGILLALSDYPRHHVSAFSGATYEGLAQHYAKTEVRLTGPFEVEW